MKPSEEFRKKMSSVTAGKSNGMFGRSHKKESINKMSKNRSGIPVSEEVRRKMSERRKGKRPVGMEDTRGEKNGNWRGGICTISKLVRSLYKYRQWRADVFTRDEFCCVICGHFGVSLHADHYPKLFSSIMNESKVKTIEEAIEYEEFWDINNGRTLCKECHRKTHVSL